MDYFNENGDSLLRVRLDTLLKDPTFTLAQFDPMIEYDFDKDRFYIAFAHGTHSAESKLVLLVSKSNDPRAGWWEYAFPTVDSINQGSWADYPNLGHNLEHIFLSGMVVQDSVNATVGNKISSKWKSRQP